MSSAVSCTSTCRLRRWTSRRRQLGEFVVVRREQRPAADAVVQVLRDAPGQRHAVVGAGAPADLVEDDEAQRRGVVEDVRRLGHLHHERALRPAQVVARADAREDAIRQADRRLLRRDETADLRH